MQPPRHTFSTFVVSDEDLLGLVAYALYKADKVAFANAHPGEDISGFVLCARLPSQMASYRNRAQVMLGAVSRKAFSIALDSAERSYTIRLRRFELALGFWRGVATAVIANLIAAAISILLVVLVFGHKLSFWSSISDYLPT